MKARLSSGVAQLDLKSPKLYPMEAGSGILSEGGGKGCKKRAYHYQRQKVMNRHTGGFAPERFGNDRAKRTAHNYPHARSEKIEFQIVKAVRLR